MQPDEDILGEEDERRHPILVLSEFFVFLGPLNRGVAVRPHGTWTRREARSFLLGDQVEALEYLESDFVEFGAPGAAYPGELGFERTRRFQSRLAQEREKIGLASRRAEVRQRGARPVQGGESLAVLRLPADASRHCLRTPQSVVEEEPEGGECRVFVGQLEKDEFLEGELAVRDLRAAGLDRG